MIKAERKPRRCRPARACGEKAKIFILIAALMIMPFTLQACKRSGSNVIIAGSTSVQPYAEILAEEYAHLFPGEDIDILGGGSSAGITAAISGAADIGMSSRSLKDAESGLSVTEIAKDGLAVIVNPGNPVTNLALEEIRGIYSGEIRDWGELGGVGANIHLITREEGSGTRSAFEELVMDGVEIVPKAIVQDSNGAVKQLVTGDANAIGYISMGLVNSNVKALRLDGVEPSCENITNGSYSLFRPFLFVTAPTPNEKARRFIDFVISRQGMQVLANEGLITGIGNGDR